MKLDEMLDWIRRSPIRRAALLQLTQPLTATQLARRARFSRSGCSHVVRQMMRCRLVRCLNADARQSRLYWLTDLGQRVQQALTAGEYRFDHDLEAMDWRLYGWACYRHRSTIIRTLDEPLQPAAIKRRARFNDHGVRMSANNVRGVIRLFRARGIVRPVWSAKRYHPSYALTQLGHRMRDLLLSAEVAQ